MFHKDDFLLAYLGNFEYTLMLIFRITYLTALLTDGAPLNDCGVELVELKIFLKRKKVTEKGSRI